MAKEITKRWEFWFVVGLSVLSVGIIAAAHIFDWLPPDVGFIQYCPAEHAKKNGQVTYFYTGDGEGETNLENTCKDNGGLGGGVMAPAGLNVKGRPWKVSVTAFDEDFFYAVRGAVEEFNDNAGCELFRMIKEGDRGDVFISKEAPEAGTSTGGTTSHVLIDGKWEASIVIYNLVMADVLERGIMHELGHAAGLAHDDFNSSLMYKGTSGGYYLTDDDKERLQERYCQ